ncbi:MAG: flavodoxin family protein [Pseudomonadota bacterium]
MTQLPTTQIVVLYHSGYGHTEQVAQHIIKGAASVAGIEPVLMSVADLDWAILAQADTLIFGAPTYMGSVSATFKQFMDDSSKIWFQLGWQDKLAAGFTNSGALSGDKQVALQQLQTFAAQHGMHWLSFPLQPTGTGPQDLNRLGANGGLMTQSDNESADITPPSGDRLTAEHFGRHIAICTLRWVRGALV